MLRRCETCAADVDDELLLQLKDWRLRTAKEHNVPAYVVFTDNTLIAIAEMLPGDDAPWSPSRVSAHASSSNSGPTCWSWSAAAAEANPQVRKSFVTGGC